MPSITGRSATAGIGAIAVNTNVVTLVGQAATMPPPGVVGAVNPIFRGFNFRSTLAYVTDTGDNFWSGPNTANSYNAGIGYGWPGTAPVSVINVNNTVDFRIAGAADLSAASTKFQYTLPNGDYLVRIGLGWSGAAGQRNLRLRLNSGSTAGVDYIDIIPGTTIGGSDTADAQGTIFTAANWPAGNVTIQVTVTQGYIQIDGGSAGGSWVRHLAVAPVVVTNVPLTGQSLTMSQANVSLGTPGGATLTGQAATQAQGALTLSVALALSGQSATATQGLIGVPKSFALTGQPMTASIGSIAFGTAKIVPLTGQFLTVNQATPVSSMIDLNGSGQSLTISQSGPVQSGIDLMSYGLGMATAQGLFTAGVPGGVTLAGQAAASQQGSIVREYAISIDGQAATLSIANVSGVPRHDVFYDITHAFDGGAFDPGGFYTSNNPSMVMGQGAVAIASNVPALRSNALVSGQGTISLSVKWTPASMPVTAGLGSITPTLFMNINGFGLTARQGGDVYTFFPDFFAGIGEDVYVPPEENVLYIDPENNEMLVY